MINTIFEKLVHGLSRDERRNLLLRIDRAAISEEPLAEEDPADDVVDLGNVYKHLGFLSRIVIFFKTLFSGRQRDAILEKDLMANIARDIQKKSSSIIDFTQKVFLPGFCEDVQILWDNTEPFVAPILEASGRNKKDFIAFLTGLHMEELQSRIIRETDPYYQIAKAVRKGTPEFTPEAWENRENMATPPSSELSDTEIKRMIEGALEDILQTIPADNRASMYQDMKVMQHLVALSHYSFEKLISAFSAGAFATPAPCSISRLKDQVVKLAEIMCNMKSPPSGHLMRALFLFSSGDKTSAALEKDVVRQITSAESALQNIREINKRMPWLLIARYVSRNLNFQCTVLGGAEDWFALLKQFWKNRIDEQYKLFSSKRKERELRGEVHAIFEPAAVQGVSGYQFLVDGEKAGGVFPISLSLIKTFFLSLFPNDMGRYLKTVLLDGIFYKEDNHKEFTDGYNAIVKAADMLEQLEARLSPQGDLAMAMAANIKDYAPAVLKRKKTQSILKEMDLEAEYLLQTTQSGLVSLSRIVNGILYGEIGGKYDSLSNLAELGGWANAEFRKGLGESLRKINDINALLQKLVAIEKSRQEKKEAKEVKA
ncbi:MAG: DUF5312 domain-containing protein [Spirochaetales bacterium]|jgi:hypothetical protein|nr:DUF5312 domain-containing protein [Spirochaetales bacterium]